MESDNQGIIVLGLLALKAFSSFALDEISKKNSNCLL